MARGLKFRIELEEGLYHPGSENKGADQLRSHCWPKAINDGKFVGCLMVDFRKAFDLVDHSLLLQKLKLYKCDENSLSWFIIFIEQDPRSVNE